MLRRIRVAIAPTLEIVIQPNHVSARNLDSGVFGAAKAPFSCSHLLCDDIDILEHACNQLFRKVTGRSSVWSFPRVKVSVPSRAIHVVERKVIEDALLNAGASQVFLEPSVQILNEDGEARTAYVEKAMRTR